MSDAAAYERRFRRAGLPLFIEDYSAGEDVFTRAAPLLALVALGELLGATQLDWPLLANVAAALGGLAILLCAFGLLNLARGRRFWSLPRHVGTAELAGFVLVPAALPLIFGGQAGSAALTLIGNLILLLIVYLWVGYGVFAILRWAGRRVFIWVRLPREVRELERDAGGDGPPRDRRQRFNVGLVMFISQALQVLVVSVTIGAFFVVFGALAVGPEVREAWAVKEGSDLLDLTLFGHPVQITEALLRVSGGIAAFAGLYYAIAVLTDSTYREEFLETVTEEMRQTFRARTEYLALPR